MARTQLTKKIRFEVFKRDGFACQYCGATPPNVILQVDHIHPVSMGGDNSINNLITACQPCNLGKSATPLSSIPKSLKYRADEVKERELQIKAYNKVLRYRANRIEDEAWEVAAILERDLEIDIYNTAKLMSIKRFLERLPLQEVIDSALKANSRYRDSGTNHFKYFCGICWNKIKER